MLRTKRKIKDEEDIIVLNREKTHNIQLDEGRMGNKLFPRPQ
jgi:hypothetical protein